MQNVSNEFKRILYGDEGRIFYGKANIILSDDTKLVIGNEDIWQGGIQISEMTSNSGNFEIGMCACNQLILKINNTTDKYSDYNFEGAVITLYIGLQLSKTVEYIKKGVFTVDLSEQVGSYISLICLDNTHMLDKPFSNVKINFPCTSLQLLQAVCTHCGISTVSTFLNSSFTIQKRPDDEALTCRDIVSYISQIAGCFARCNVNGGLELKWYDIGAFEQSDLDGGTFDKDNPYSSGDTADGGNFIDYNTGSNIDGGTFLQMKRYHHIYSLSQATISTDDVVITGIKVENADSENGYSAMFGVDGYVLSIVDNPLIQSQPDAVIIANSVGAKIVGMMFRVLSVSAKSDPTVEAGDVAFISDRKGNSYQTLITSLNYTIGSYMSIACDAETPSRNSSTRYSAVTKSVVKARNEARKEITAYDLAVQQLTNLMVNSFGAFKSEEKLEDGSTIYYMHNKPTRAESQTVWKMTADAFAVSTDGGKTWNAGIDSQGNAVVNVLNAIGINANWINAGEINGISIKTNTGQIGPFRIGKTGLFSDIMEFYENNNYPLIWLTKKGPNGEPWGANNTERANLEPSVVVVRSIDENGKRTDVNLFARKNPDSGRTGEISISKWGNEIIHDATLSTDGIYIDKQESGVRLENVELTPHGLFLQNEDGYYTFITQSGSITFSEDQVSFTGANCQITMSEDGDISISGQKGSIYMTDDTYINSPGDIYLNGFPADLQQMQNDIMAIKAKLNMS
jgi:hypothetical protein